MRAQLENPPTLDAIRDAIYGERLEEDAGRPKLNQRMSRRLHKLMRVAFGHQDDSVLWPQNGTLRGWYETTHPFIMLIEWVGRFPLPVKVINMLVEQIKICSDEYADNLLIDWIGMMGPHYSLDELHNREVVDAINLRLYRRGTLGAYAVLALQCPNDMFFGLPKPQELIDDKAPDSLPPPKGARTHVGKLPIVYPNNSKRSFYRQDFIKLMDIRLRRAPTPEIEKALSYLDSHADVLIMKLLPTYLARTDHQRPTVAKHYRRRYTWACNSL